MYIKWNCHITSPETKRGDTVSVDTVAKAEANGATRAEQLCSYFVSKRRIFCPTDKKNHHETEQTCKHRGGIQCNVCDLMVVIAVLYLLSSCCPFTSMLFTSSSNSWPWRKGMTSLSSSLKTWRAQDFELKEQQLVRCCQSSKCSNIN